MKRYEATPELDEEQTTTETDDPMAGIEKVEDEDSKAGFPEEYMEPLCGLLFLGSLSKNFTYAGHEFLIETLNEGEVLKVGQRMSEYRGTLSEMEARKAFTVAACVRAVDGYPVTNSLVPGQETFDDRLQVVLKWYPPVIKYIYDRYRELEVTEFEVASALKK